MNADTKRHIDAARQVLVGVVPNPTSQIEQITNALIYKFMDDMDQASIKLGGKPSFFVGDLEVYTWTRVMDPRVGNQERMNLYSEALLKFSQAKQLPELFRGIFKSALLPYRSPETLGLFLKEIDYFDYSHPEELGNAYEYLLSIMSSQGDAGQFRTPRHIIDFIVDVVNPTKEDKVLDPACGTGGFLVSTYKHILEQHDGIDDQDKKEKPLTPDERRKLMENFEGYDIDPTMVRISQVNMYLHQFKKPRIFQYDGLSNDERWGDKFDVILANPPFMSPKGGIKPHSKFSIQSSRSEVLFVDYIMNHLRPKGRAGIIVPEGVIFQSGTAHKELRKNLVNDGLYAVVSLPSGVFAPYSGVKTSILLFNNGLAKSSSEILFIKIENDGLSLGAQRKVVKGNQLPEALEILNKWNTGQRVENKLALYVEKEQLAQTGDYSLSSDRYRVKTDHTQTIWPMVKLSDVFTEIKNGKNVEQFDEVGKYRVSRIQTIATGEVDLQKTKYTNDEIPENDFLKEGDILFSHINSIDHLAKTAIFENSREKVVHGSNLIRLRPDLKKIVPRFALYQLKYEAFIENARRFAQKAVNQASINSTAIKSLQFPLPPVEIQQEIVVELDGYASIIAGAQKVVKNWRPKVEIDSEWEQVRLGDVCEIFGGGTPVRTEEKYWGGNIPWISAKYFSDDHRIIGSEMITEEGLVNSSSKIAPRFSTILITRVSVGKFAIADQDYAINQDLTALVPKNKNIDSKYLWFISEVVAERIKNSAVGVGVTGVTRDFVVNQKIPLPPLVTQKQIVEKIEAERKLVESTEKLIGIYEKKIKEKIAKLWSE